MKLKAFLNELRRRNVIKAAISYVIFSWIFIQAASILFPTFGLGDRALRILVIVLCLGFPIWIVFAYVFEWTPEGFKKTNEVAEETSISRNTGKKMNGIIIAGMSLAILLLVADRIFNFTGATAPSEIVEADTNIDKSIAVLAFADMSPEKDQEYFSDGISEEILNLLAKVPDLKVISRTSSFSYKGKEANIKKIGEELQVGHVLEGSIRKSGNTFRITTQLISVKDGSHLWSETYDREMSDIFKIQDEIASKVTQQLKITLLGELASTPVNIEAYNLYLQAKQVRLQQTAEATKNAEILIRQSIAIDATYAPSWSVLSQIIFAQIHRYGTLTMIEETIETYMAAAKKAIALDPNYGNAYAVLAGNQNFNWDFKSSNTNMKKALALAPETGTVVSLAAGNAQNLGKLEESLQLYLKAIDLDPLNYSGYFNLSLTYYLLKDYNNAEEAMKIFLLHYPAASTAHSQIALIYLGLGKNAKSLEALEKEPDPFFKLYRKCMVVNAIGDKKEAEALLKEFVETYGVDSWPNIASVYAFRKEKDEAFKWLDLAYEQRDGSLLEILNYPEMENLWGDPRWHKFIDKLGLPKDHGFHRD